MTSPRFVGPFPEEALITPPHLHPYQPLSVPEENRERLSTEFNRSAPSLITPRKREEKTPQPPPSSPNETWLDQWGLSKLFGINKNLQCAEVEGEPGERQVFCTNDSRLLKEWKEKHGGEDLPRLKLGQGAPIFPSSERFSTDGFPPDNLSPGRFSTERFAPLSPRGVPGTQASFPGLPSGSPHPSPLTTFPSYQSSPEITSQLSGFPSYQSSVGSRMSYRPSPEEISPLTTFPSYQSPQSPSSGPLTTFPSYQSSSETASPLSSFYPKLPPRSPRKRIPPPIYNPSLYSGFDLDQMIQSYQRLNEELERRLINIIDRSELDQLTRLLEATKPNQEVLNRLMNYARQHNPEAVGRLREVGGKN